MKIRLFSLKAGVRLGLGMFLASWTVVAAVACGSGVEPEDVEAAGSETQSTELALEGASCGTSAECEKGEFCDLGCPNMFKPGVCTTVPDRCFDVYKPVCGCDNRTYSNDCYRRKAKVGLKSKEACSRFPQ
jgi:hypothetical protein